MLKVISLERVKMPRTVTEVQAELTTVNAAIQNLIAKKSITQLKVG